MKASNIKLAAVATLTLAALCASSLWAVGTGAQAQGNHKFYSLVVATGAEGYDVQWRDDRVVGMRALRPDGRWFDLRPYAPPPDEGTTPRFKCPGLTEVPHCYEDDDLQMTVCICVEFIAMGGGPVVGPVIDSWQFAKQPSR